MSWYWHLLLFTIWAFTYLLFFTFSLVALGFLARIVIPLLWFSVPFFFGMKAYIFSRNHRKNPGLSLWHFFIAFIHFPLYQWSVRLRLPLDSREISSILHDARSRIKVDRPSSVLCPFCKIEIAHALEPLPNERLGVTRRPLLCPKCELRFDSCRYCAYFERSSGNLPYGYDEGGKCTVIKERQPVENLCSPTVALRMKNMGWESLYAGKKINDPFAPPDRCRRFLFQEESAHRDGIPEMGLTRCLLLLLEKTKSKN